MNLYPTLSNKMANMGFVGACLVVSLHVSQKLRANGLWGDIAKYFAECGIGECAVPFFFIASGFFLGFDPTVVPQHSHLWFVRALMFAIAVSPVFLLLRKKVSGMFCLLAFVIVCELVRTWIVDGVSDWKRAFAISGWFRGLSFFAIGVYLRHNPLETGRWGFWRTIRWGRVICLVFALFPWPFRAFLAWQGFDAIVQKIELPTLLLSVYCLFEAIPDSPWPKWLTACAFPIYLIHGPVLVVFVATCRAVGLKEYLSHCSIVFYVLFWAAAVGVSITATLLLRKVRWLSAIAFGGR